MEPDGLQNSKGNDMKTLNLYSYTHVSMGYARIRSERWDSIDPLYRGDMALR